jgi:hypothetical protein
MRCRRRSKTPSNKNARYAAHSAPIMSTLLGKSLHYLSDEALARAIMTGTYEVPSDMDPATKLIL